MAELPISLESLPKPLQKHVDPAAPLPLRMMGAKGLVPAVAPGDLVTMLFVLTFDADAGVAEAATKTADGLPERIASVALRSDDLPGAVLDWLADRNAGRDAALELLLLNAATPDATVARLAATVPERLVEIIRQNELRMLRHDDVIRQLCLNPAALVSTIDGACDFCVRNGLMLADVGQLVEAHKRIFGTDPTKVPLEPQETAAALIEEFRDVLATEAAPETSLSPASDSPEVATKRLNISQRVIRMSVSEKIKLATLGNKEARTILLRDSNKLVCMASVTSPRITDGEILGIANSRTVNSEVLRHVFTKRDFLKTYAIKMALVKNPKVPLPTALKLMLTLQEKDIKELSRDRNVPQTIQAQARAWMMKKEAAAKGPGSEH